ncbi:ribonuclease HII [Clostridium sp. MCC353]|uniref:ribonuclease HII n=1 Tax=Clostridium sp. MCC353 TaxID=2592646 RepID=UPI001C019490|nr:ribonuclease HII [Clostridium sp. MCC353]MBT9776229.1 ribonuclease HII [Clostridium sp. MCC353]
MIKLNILNMKRFLLAVNDCSGPVSLLDGDGRKEDINKNFLVQRKLLNRHMENGKYSRLVLEIAQPKDYMNIVFYYIGDC